MKKIIIITLLIISMCALASADWDKNKPEPGIQAQFLDDRVRTNNAALEDALARDHNFPGTMSTNAGEHTKIKFYAPIVTPTFAANKGFLYVKDVSAKLELFFLDEDGHEIQITTGGYLNPLLAAGSVSNSMLAADSITTLKILDAAITSTKINDGAVTANKIAAGAVDSSQLASTSVTPGSYTRASITVDADGRITAASSGITDDDVPESGDFGNAASLNADGSLKVGTVTNSHIVSRAVDMYKIEMYTLHALPMFGSTPLAQSMHLNTNTSYSTASGYCLEYTIIIPATASTLKMDIRARLTDSDDGSGDIRLSCGGLNSTAITIPSQTLAWGTLELDVSSLSGRQTLYVQFLRTASQSLGMDVYQLVSYWE